MKPMISEKAVKIRNRRNIVYSVIFIVGVTRLFFIPRDDMEIGIVLAILAFFLIVWVLWFEHKLKKERKSNHLLPQNQFSLMNKEKPQVFNKMGLWLSRNQKKIVYQVFWSYFLFLIFLFVFNIEINRLISFIFWFLFGLYVGSRLTHKAIGIGNNKKDNQ